MEALELVGVLMREFDVHAYPRNLLDPQARSGQLEAWLPWEDRFVLTGHEVDHLGISVVPTDRLGSVLTSGSAQVVIRVTAPARERLNAFAQALIDHEAHARTHGIDQAGRVLVPVSVLDPADTDLVTLTLDSLIDRALTILHSGQYGTPMQPVSAQADVLATLLADALGGQAGSWDALMHHVTRHSDLVDVAVALTYQPGIS